MPDPSPDAGQHAEASAEAVILCDVDAHGIARLRFNRPKALNALGAALAERFLELAQRLAAPGGARVIVMSGEGRAFMAGGDLQAFHRDLDGAGGTARAIIDPLHEGLVRLAEGDAPIIARVHGAVAGAGMSLMMGADMAIASSDAKFSMAYSRIAANLDAGGSWALPRILGLHRAMEIALLSDPFDAQQALEMGLLNRVVAPEALAAETDALALRLAAGPTRAYGRIRRLVRRSLERDFKAQLAAEGDAFVEGTLTDDFGEGIRAFFEKRQPRFTGQ